MGQNLVPNYSFEQETSCFTQNIGFQMPEINYANGWSMPTMGTADHFHPCHTGGFGQFTPPNTWAGDKLPQDGNAYAGLMTYEFGTSVDYKEYMQIALTSPLVAGATYDIGFYYSLSNNSQYMTDGLGMRLETGATSQPTNQGPIGVPSHLEVSGIQTDTSGWTLLQGTYTAIGGEDHLIIGCFTSSTILNITSNTYGFAGQAYYFIDSVFVSIPCDPTITSGNTYCETAAPVDLNAITEGTWSGPGITNTNTGTFDPQLAGPGTHQIINSITGLCTDADTLLITVGPPDAHTISYNQATYCDNEPNPVPTITGVQGGTFSISNGGIMNSSTGAINLSPSGPGLYTISYSTNSICPNTSTTDVEIIEFQDPTITSFADTICLGEPVFQLTATDPGGQWTGPGIVDALTGEFNSNISGAGQHWIYYATSGPCSGTDSILITVSPIDSAAFSYPSSLFCESELFALPDSIYQSGGIFGITPTGVIDIQTGEIDLLSSGPGSYTISYSTTGYCADSSTFNLTIEPNSNATIQQIGPFCEGEIDQNLTVDVPGGAWSGSGIVDPANGVFSPQTAGIGSHDVIYALNGNCTLGDTIQVSVNPTNAADFYYSFGTELYVNENSEAAIITGVSGGVFSINNGVIDQVTGMIDLSLSSPGAYTVCYTSPGPCFETFCIDVEIIEVNDVIVNIPNVFTPNNDLVNDLFTIEIENYSSFEGILLNRWGKTVFEWNDVATGWDGTINGNPASEGTYFYKISVIGINGDINEFSGFLELTR